MSYKTKDHYFKKAKEGNFAARSVFKLEEIDQKYHIFKAGQRVLDLGAAPGSWSQYVSKRVGLNGFIFGIDLKEIKISLKNAKFVVADILETNIQDLVGDLKLFDVVMSDMAPQTTGIKFTDQERSLELCEMALETAKAQLKNHGSFICKLFHGESFTQFRGKLKEEFNKVEVLKPKSTRKTSKEIFLICTNYKGLSVD